MELGLNFGLGGVRVLDLGLCAFGRQGEGFRGFMLVCLKRQVGLVKESVDWRVEFGVCSVPNNYQGASL